MCSTTLITVEEKHYCTSKVTEKRHGPDPFLNFNKRPLAFITRVVTIKLQRHCSFNSEHESVNMLNVSNSTSFYSSH